MPKILFFLIVSIISIFSASCTIDKSHNTVKYDISSKNFDNTPDNVFVNQSNVKQNTKQNSNSHKSISRTQSKEQRYQLAINYLKNGEKDKGLNILQDLVNKFPNYTKAQNILARMDSPFTLAAITVEEYLNNWIAAPTNLPPFSAKLPSKPIIPNPPILNKGEFETVNNFNNRVQISQQKYLKKLKSIKNNYKLKIQAYNNKVDLYNQKIKWERKSRLEKLPLLRKRYLDIAFAEVLGAPKVKDLKYIADSEVFYGKLVSEYNNLTLDIAVQIPMQEAKEFKQNINLIKPTVKISMIDGNIVFSNLLLNINNKKIPAKILNTKQLLALRPEVDINFNKKDVNLSRSLKSINTYTNTNQENIGITADTTNMGITFDDIVVKKIKPLNTNQIIEQNRIFFIPKK